MDGRNTRRTVLREKAKCKMESAKLKNVIRDKETMLNRKKTAAEDAVTGKEPALIKTNK